MDWLRDFQQSFREPVFAFLSSYWQFLLAVAAVGVAWWLSDGFRRRRTASGASDGAGDFDDTGGSDGGGDGGGD